MIDYCIMIGPIIISSLEVDLALSLTLISNRAKHQAEVGSSDSNLSELCSKYQLC